MSNIRRALESQYRRRRRSSVASNAAQWRRCFRRRWPLSMLLVVFGPCSSALTGHPSTPSPPSSRSPSSKRTLQIVVDHQLIAIYNTKWLYCVEWTQWTQYSAWRLRSTMPSVTCLRLSDVSVICRVTYLQFPIRLAFLPYRSARRHSSVVDIPNIGHRMFPKISVGRFLVRSVQPREVISNWY